MRGARTTLTLTLGMVCQADAWVEQAWKERFGHLNPRALCRVRRAEDKQGTVPCAVWHTRMPFERHNKVCGRERVSLFRSLTTKKATCSFCQEKCLGVLAVAVQMARIGAECEIPRLPCAISRHKIQA